MANEEKVLISVVVDDKQANKSLETVTKKTKETGSAAKDAAADFSIMGVSLNSIKGAFGKVIPIAKAMFGTIKAGILSTGIGALLIAFGALMQFFRDSEEGAGKLKQIMSAVGVVFGNVTDIISDAGKALFALMTGNMTEFKKSLKEATDGVKNFGETTRREMQVAIQLEKDRLSLQKFEREALVSKAKVESEIMELRLKARDIEKFSSKERLGFMRKANKLADEQLAKDLKVAEEKLRFQQVENSFSKSTQENLDAEAQLQAQVFQIQRSNFSERKRMKSEEQAIVRAAAAEEKAALLEIEKIKTEQAAKSLKLENEITIAQAEQGKERERLALEIAFRQAEQAEEDFGIQMLLATKYAQDLQALDKKYLKINKDLKDKADAEELADAKLLADQKTQVRNMAFDAAADLFGRETAAGKAAAVAQATMNTYEGAARANKDFPVPLNFVAMGVIIAAGLQQVRKIVDTPTPKKMATGGLVGGMGTGTSDSVNARLSKGESVINARSTRMFKPLLSAINEAGGGAAFADKSSISTQSQGITGGVVKAFVVADEMTSTQDRLTKIRRKATI